MVVAHISFSFLHIVLFGEGGSFAILPQADSHLTLFQIPGVGLTYSAGLAAEGHFSAAQNSQVWINDKDSCELQCETVSLLCGHCRVHLPKPGQRRSRDGKHWMLGYHLHSTAQYSELVFIK